MIKQHLMLFKLMLSVLLIKECCFNVESIEFEYEVFLGAKKRGCNN